MKKHALSYLLFLISAVMFLSPLTIFAQGSTLQPSETLWTTGKIFVVLIVAGTIFAGIGLFLLILERKISKLEKTIADKNL